MSLVPIRQRESDRWKRCGSCEETVKAGEEYVTVEGESWHVFCAADAGAGITRPCPTCFMLDCDQPVHQLCEKSPDGVMTHHLVPTQAGEVRCRYCKKPRRELVR